VHTEGFGFVCFLVERAPLSLLWRTAGFAVDFSAAMMSDASINLCPRSKHLFHRLFSIPQAERSFERVEVGFRIGVIGGSFSGSSVSLARFSAIPGSAKVDVSPPNLHRSLSLVGAIPQPGTLPKDIVCVIYKGPDEAVGAENPKGSAPPAYA